MYRMHYAADSSRKDSNSEPVTVKSWPAPVRVKIVIIIIGLIYKICRNSVKFLTNIN